MNAELAVEILDVRFHRVGRHAEAVGDLGIRAAQSEQLHHLRLACAEKRLIHVFWGFHFASAGNPVASHGTKVTSSTPMPSTQTGGTAARNTSGSGLPKR